MTKALKNYAKYILSLLFVLALIFGVISSSDLKKTFAVADSSEIVVYDFGDTEASATATQGTATIEDGALKLTGAWWVNTTFEGISIPEGYSYMTMRMKANQALTGVLFNCSYPGTSLYADDATGFSIDTAYQTYTVQLNDNDCQMTNFNMCVCDDDSGTWKIVYVDYIMFHKDANAKLDDYSGVYDFGNTSATVSATQGTATVENDALKLTGAWWVNATFDGVSVPSGYSYMTMRMKANQALTEIFFNCSYPGTSLYADDATGFSIGTEYQEYTVSLNASGCSMTNFNMCVCDNDSGTWKIVYVDYIMFHNGTEQTLADSVSVSQGDSVDLSVYKKFVGVTVNGEAVNKDLSAYNFTEAGEYVFSGIGVVNGVKTTKTTTVTVQEAETLTMFTGAAVRIKKDNSDQAGIRFAAKLNNYDEANENQYGMLIIPTDYLTQYSISGDYVAAFAAQSVKIANMACLPVYGDFDKDGNDEYYIQASLTEIKYKNLNREFVGIGYILDLEGNYRYTVYNEQENSRSIAYVASMALKDYEADTTSDGYQTCLTYIHGAVNEENGVTESEGYTTISAFALSAEDVTLTSIGESKTLNVVQSPAMGYRVTYTSNNTDIATVDENGCVTSVSEGTTTVTAKCADKNVEVAVTVDLPDDYSGLVDFGGNVTNATGVTIANSAASFNASSNWWPATTAEITFDPIAVKGAGDYTTVTMRVRATTTIPEAGAYINFIGTNANGETVSMGTAGNASSYINLVGYSLNEWHEIDFTVPNANIVTLTGISTAFCGWTTALEIDYILFHNGTVNTITAENGVANQNDVFEVAEIFDGYAVSVSVDDGARSAVAETYTFASGVVHTFTGVRVVSGCKEVKTYTVIVNNYDGLVDFGGNVTNATGVTIANNAASFNASSNWWPATTAEITFDPITVKGAGDYTTVTIKVRATTTIPEAGAYINFIGTNANGETVSMGTAGNASSYINLVGYSLNEWHEIDFTVPNANIVTLTGISTAFCGWTTALEIDYILFHNGTTEYISDSIEVNQGDTLDMSAVFDSYAGVTVCVNDGETTTATLSENYLFEENGTYIFTGVGIKNGKKVVYTYTVDVKKIIPEGYTDIFGLEEYVAITATQGTVSNNADDGATILSGAWWVYTTLDNWNADTKNNTVLDIPNGTNYMIVTMKANTAMNDVFVEVYGTDGATIYYKEAVSGNGVSLTTEYQEYKFLIETVFYNVARLNVCAQNQQVYIQNIRFESEIVETDIVYQQNGVNVSSTAGVVSKDLDESLLIHGNWWVQLAFSGVTIPADADKVAITLKTNSSYSGDLYIAGTGLNGEVLCENYSSNEYKEYVFDLTTNNCEFTTLRVLMNANVGNSKVNIMSIRFYDSSAKMAYWGPVAYTTDSDNNGGTLTDTDKANLQLYKSAGLNVFTITAPNALGADVNSGLSIEGTTTKAILDYATELGMKVIVCDSALQCLSHSRVPLVKAGGTAYAIWQYVEGVGRVYFAEGVTLGQTVTAIDGGNGEHTVTVDDTALFQFDSQDELNAFVLSRMSAYAKHSAYYGVEFWDEPQTESFAAAGQLLDAIAYADKQLKTYSYVQQCLLPSYGFSDLATFKAYVEAYATMITTHGDGIISTIRSDVYPLNVGKVECGLIDYNGNYMGQDYITCIQTLASVAKAYGLDWELTVQSYGHEASGKRAVSENGLKWQVAMAYAFGAKNVSYYSFTGDTHGSYDGCIVSGAYTTGYTTTDLYTYVQKATAYAEKMQAVLNGYAYNGSTMEAVNKDSKYQSYNSYGYYYDAISDENVSDYSITSATYTATLTQLVKGSSYAYGLMNMADPDKTESNSVTISLNGVTSATVYRYSTDGTNNVVSESVSFNSNSYTFTLGAGEGVIIIPNA